MSSVARDRVINQHELQLEWFSAGRLPDFSRLKTVVGIDDGTPAGPNIKGKSHRLVLQRLISTDPFYRRQFFGCGKRIFFDRRRLTAIGSFKHNSLWTSAGVIARTTRGANWSRRSGSDTARLPNSKWLQQTGPPRGQTHQTKDYDPQN